MREYILACIDNSASAKGVCDAAIYFAKYYNTGITLLHALEFNDDVDLNYKNDLIDANISSTQSENLLNHYQNYCEKSGISTTTLNLHGDLTDLITTIQSEYKLLIIGKLGELELGSKIKIIIKNVDLPILLANKEFCDIVNVLYAYDGSKSLDMALNKSLVNPLVKNVNRTLLHLNKDSKKAKIILANVKKIFDKYNKDIKLLSLDKNNASDLVEFANDYDLIVMGAYKNKTIKHIIFGSFTNEVIKNSSKPILILK